jgi:hypothetical protein
MGVKSRVGPRVQIERSPKNDVLALVLHAAVNAEIPNCLQGPAESEGM